MLDEKRKKEAKSNFTRYLQEGLLKKESNELAKSKYIENADISLKTAHELMQSQLKPYLWVIVTAYYSMFYMANAMLLHYVIESYELELDKRSRFQYNMLEQTKENKAQTSIKRASEFVFDLKKLLKSQQT